MHVRLVNPKSLVAPKGYAHGAVGTGRELVLAGQIGCDASGRITAPGDLVAQFAQALDNLLAVVREAGGTPQDVARLRLFTTDVPGYRAALADLGAAYRARFGKHFPAMALVGVTELFEPEALIEIEGQAYLGDA